MHSLSAKAVPRVTGRRTHSGTRTRAEAASRPLPDKADVALDSELEAVTAAVEALRIENERLKVRLEREPAETIAPPVVEVSRSKAVEAGVNGTPAALRSNLRKGSSQSSSSLPTRSEPVPSGAAEGFAYPPVTGDGWGILQHDKMLENHKEHLAFRWNRYRELRAQIDANEGSLEKFSRGYERMGFTHDADGITYREWAPSARTAALIGDFNNWDGAKHAMTKDPFGVFELRLPNAADGTPAIPHGSRVKIRMQTASGGSIDKIPAWIRMAVQAPGEIPFNGVYYNPPAAEQHVFVHPRPPMPKSLRIYEAHVGMSSIEPKISTYAEFRDTVLPRIKYLGYNAVQLMAIQEHAYYASFGYHVTNFFATSSRCGTPDDLKSLIDRAHELGIVVLMDIVHSHASSNALDGLNQFDGSDSQYFHAGPQGYHWMWDSRCFNYREWEVLRFLLSNLRYWAEDFKFDGFRFDGVTSMMYKHHGLSTSFSGNYGEYFGMATDVDAMVYLMLANDMLHTLYPGAMATIAEDVSGMPTLGRPVGEGGVGFDYRLQMAIADKWIEALGKWGPDEAWDLGNLVFTMENRRYGERCISYAESHDQALVGDKTIAFWLMDKDMYDGMSTTQEPSTVVSRGIALHKMIRAFTMGLGGEGYLNFMGNEFGHPEWIDFPREDRTEKSTGKFIPGNGNSYHLCRRRFDLADMDHLRYKHMYSFDAALNASEEALSFLSSSHQFVSRKDNREKMVVFERGDAVFVFNWHPTRSYTNYRVGCRTPGVYGIALNSDKPEFGGFGNVAEGVEFNASTIPHDGRPASFLIYAPSRTVVVYALRTDLTTLKQPLLA